VENIDCYRDQDMGDIILEEPFCKVSYVEARRFDGLIIIHNGSDNVTYQMARSHPKFQHLSNAQCNRIKPLLNVSMYDMLNGISHPYQNLKSFYKGVLNLGPEYVRDVKDLAESKEIDDVGGESTIWKSGSVRVLKLQDDCSTQILAHKLNMENLPSKILGEFLILILF
ncbi:hypothetical protein Tco_0869683, partial [Tanacetum coccineum]